MDRVAGLVQPVVKGIVLEGAFEKGGERLDVVLWVWGKFVGKDDG